MTNLGIIHNIAVLAAICFLVAVTGSGWWVLLALLVLVPSKDE